LYTSATRRPRKTQGCRGDDNYDDDDDDTSFTLLERREFSECAKKNYETRKRLIAICTQHCAKSQEMKINSAEIHAFVGASYKGMYRGVDGLETCTFQSLRKLSTVSAGTRDVLA
jgi:hypothetical protein